MGNQDKIPYQGRQSFKSSDRWFGGGRALHERGNGASAGNGKTSDKTVLAKIIVVFKRGNRQTLPGMPGGRG